MANYIKINGFRAEVLSERRYLWLRPANPAREGEAVELDGRRVTARVIEQAVADAGFEVEAVVARHERYVRYTLRTVMRERSGCYDRVAIYNRDDSGKWVKVREDLNNGIY